MNATATTAIVLSAAVLTGWVVYRQFRQPRRVTLVASLVALGIYLAALHWTFGFPSVVGAESKSGETTAPVFPAIVLYMYVAMVLGMVSEYLYNYLDAGHSERGFDLGSLIKPVLVSPLVFIPLASSLQTASVDLTLGIPRFMLFLVAFENGFLWRGYFSRKMSGAEASASIK